MSVVLYQKGKQHDINGLVCDIMLVKPEYFYGELPEGWFFSPEDAHGLQKGSEEKHEEENTEEVKEKVLKNPEIRQAAKDAGIENWKTARIETLKEALK